MWPCLLALAAGWLGFANPLVHLPFLALLVPAAFCLLARGAASGKQAFRDGFFAGMFMYAACIYWVAIPVHDFGLLPWILAGPCPLLLGAYMGLFTAAFTAGMRWVGSRLGPGAPIVYAIFGGALWATLEWVRGWFITGFPWVVLPQAFAIWPWAIQAVALIGSHGLAALFAAASCAGAAAVEATPIDRRRACAAWSFVALVLGAVAAYGQYALSASPQNEARVPVSLVQGNIDQSRKWDKAFQHETVERYLSLSRAELQANKPGLVVWPETAMPFYFQELSPLSRQVHEFSALAGTCLLLGAPGYEPNPATTGGYDLYNRAFLLDATGSKTGVYAKEHLVPYGEYVPLGEYFPFLNKLVEGIGDFRPGRRLDPLRCGELAMGMLICYEAIFPELAQSRVAAGANVLVNISNDAWYGRSSAPAQHLHLSVLRAVEQGRWLIRATNTGVSAFVDAKGRILASTGLFETTTLFHAVAPETRMTVYHRLNAFVPGILIGLVLCSAALAIRSGKPAPKKQQK